MGAIWLPRLAAAVTLKPAWLLVLEKLRQFGVVYRAIAVLVVNVEEAVYLRRGCAGAGARVGVSGRCGCSGRCQRAGNREAAAAAVRALRAFRRRQLTCPRPESTARQS